MTLPFRSALAGLFAAGLLILFGGEPSFAPAQENDRPPRPRRVLHVLGTDVFRRLLYEFHLRYLRDFGQLQEDPRHSVLVVFGDPSCLSTRFFPKGLRPFVEAGGAVLIATDRGTSGDIDRHLRELAGVSVTGETLVCKEAKAGTCYADTGYCPYVQPARDPAEVEGSTDVWGALSAVLGSGGKPALFRNARPDRPDLRVATNAPSRLLEASGLGLAPGIHRLAVLPDDCRDEAEHDMAPRRLDSGRNGGLLAKVRGFFPRREEENAPRPAPLFAVGGTVGQGRVLVLADHSLFINRMILPRDNGNLEFAANVLHWLRGGASTPREAMQALNGLTATPTVERDRALFWEDGKIRTDFDVPLQDIPLEPPQLSEPAIVRAVDRAVARLEETDAFNRKLLQELGTDSWSMSKWKRDALAGLTLAGLFLLALVFLWGNRHRRESSVPSLAHVLARHDAGATLLEQRHRQALRAGNVWETAHHLARQCFESEGIALTVADAPALTIEGGWWQRRRIRRRIARLWRLARGTTPARVTPAQLQHWLRELAEFKTALANGTIRTASSAPAD